MITNLMAIDLRGILNDNHLKGGDSSEILSMIQPNYNLVRMEVE